MKSRSAKLRRSCKRRNVKRRRKNADLKRKKRLNLSRDVERSRIGLRKPCGRLKRLKMLRMPELSKKERCARRYGQVVGSISTNSKSYGLKA